MGCQDVYLGTALALYIYSYIDYLLYMLHLAHSLLFGRNHISFRFTKVALRVALTTIG